MSILSVQSPHQNCRPFPTSLRAIGLDWDGTLVQPDRAFIQEIAVATMRKLGYLDLSERQIESAFATNCPFKLLDPTRATVLHHLFYQEVDKLNRPVPKVIAGVPEALAELKAQGLLLGIGTARMQSPKFYPEVVATGLNIFIDAYVMRSDPYDMGSVKDSQLRRLFSELWTSTENALFAGDTTDDHTAAANTNIYSVGVLSGLACRAELLAAPQPPSALIASVGELPDFIAKRQQELLNLAELRMPAPSAIDQNLLRLEELTRARRDGELLRYPFGPRLAPSTGA